MSSHNLKEWLSENYSEYKPDREARLKFLYSAFSSRKELNPVGYDSAVKWWQNVLDSGVKEGKLSSESRLVLNVNRDLVESFRVDTVGIPLSVGTVVLESYSQGKVTRLSDILEKPSWKGRLFSMMRWWAPSADDESNWNRAAGEWVFVDGIKEKTSQILKSLQHKQPQELLCDKSELNRVFNVESSFDAKVLTSYMVSEKLVHVDDKEPSLVKLSPEKITPSDIQIFSLTQTLKSIEAKRKNLHERFMSEHQQAQDLVKDMQREQHSTSSTSGAQELSSHEKVSRNLILHHLRNKKNIENTLEQLTSSKEKIQDSLDAIERAVTDQETLKAMRNASVVLDQTTGIKYDEAVDILDHWNEAKLHAEEITDTINDGLMPQLSEQDVEAIDEELAELESQQAVDQATVREGVSNQSRNKVEAEPRRERAGEDEIVLKLNDLTFHSESEEKVDTGENETEEKLEPQLA